METSAFPTRMTKFAGLDLAGMNCQKAIIKHVSPRRGPAA